MANTEQIRVYEAMFLVDSGLAASWDDLARQLGGILTRHGAEVIGLTRWDERKLAYPVGKQKRGTYALAFFTLANGAAVAEIERDCQLSEQILRTLVLRADHYTVIHMRMQLGEDLNEDVAKKLAEARGEPLVAAPAAPAAPPAQARPAPARDAPPQTPATGGEAAVP